MCSSHFARAFREVRVVRVIDENTWPAHSANFENGMETGLDILFSQIGNIIMIELSRYFASANEIRSVHFIFLFVNIFQPSKTLT